MPLQSLAPDLEDAQPGHLGVPQPPRSIRACSVPYGSVKRSSRTVGPLVAPQLNECEAWRMPISVERSAQNKTSTEPQDEQGGRRGEPENHDQNDGSGQRVAGRHSKIRCRNRAGSTTQDGPVGGRPAARTAQFARVHLIGYLRARNPHRRAKCRSGRPPSRANSPDPAGRTGRPARRRGPGRSRTAGPRPRRTAPGPTRSRARSARRAAGRPRPGWRSGRPD